MEKELNEIIELMQKPVVEYIKNLMKKAGIDLTTNEAENILSNLGTHMRKKKLNNQNDK